jgi:hypothetical protein
MQPVKTGSIHADLAQTELDFSKMHSAKTGTARWHFFGAEPPVATRHNVRKVDPAPERIYKQV